MENTAIGAEGMVKIEYLGDQMSFTISGDKTNARYTFGKDRPKGWIDPRDLGTREGLSGDTGFLTKRDRQTGKYLYKLAEEAVAPEPKPVAVTQVVEENAPSVPQGVAEATGTLSATENVAEKSVTLKSDVPNPTDLTVEEIKLLELTQDQWLQVYQIEMAGRNRKSAITFIEETLAGFS